MNYFAAKEYILQRLAAELSPHLTYHGIQHTKDVWSCALDICQRENVREDARLLVATAALYHDAGFLISWTDHEYYGCQLVKKVLPNFGYTTNDITSICGMIQATKIPQSPKNHLEEILCDADLDYLGRSDFYDIGQLLYQELKYLGHLNTQMEWNQVQISFLKQHRYFTKSTQHRRGVTKELHLTKLERWLEQASI